MKTALRRLRQLLPFLVGGVVITLFVAWGLPIVLASRGSGDFSKLATNYIKGEVK